ncbi:Uncharacterised protein [Klebsiella variicola]|nr:Uncharacterised protein [Klebsiella variicola]SYU49956.1 Uncharacterised protein [Klebsiella pneumoniae]
MQRILFRYECFFKEKEILYIHFWQWQTAKIFPNLIFF